MRSKGFTLIELLVTVGLVGVVSTIAVYNYKSYTVRSQASEAIQLMNNERLTIAKKINEGQCTTKVGVTDTYKGKYGVLAVTGSFKPTQGTSCPTGCTIEYSFNSSGISKELQGKSVVADLLHNGKLSKNSSKTTVDSKYLSPTFVTIPVQSGDNCTALAKSEGTFTNGSGTAGAETASSTGSVIPGTPPAPTPPAGGTTPTTPPAGGTTPTTPPAGGTTPTTPDPTPPTPPTTTGDATYLCKGDANNFVIYNWWQEKQYGASQESFDPTFSTYADSSAYFIVDGQIQTELLVNHAYAVNDKRDSYSGKLNSFSGRFITMGNSGIATSKIPVYGATLDRLQTQYGYQKYRAYWDGWYIEEICFFNEVGLTDEQINKAIRSR